jgi:hypothetical protein
MRTSLLGVLSLLAACKSEGNFSNQNGSDEWAQSPSDQVDILFIVDNSFSMTEEQEALAAGFPAFVEGMTSSNTDFHLGVISTSFDYDDENRGLLIGEPPVLTKNDDYVQGFLDRVKIGTDGSDKEKGLEAAEYALSPALQSNGRNAGFIRAEAQLLLVVVSDEEDCSDNFALEGQPPEACYNQMDDLTPVDHFVQVFQAMKTHDDFVRFASIVGLDGSCPNAFPGGRYMQLSAYTSGVVGNICDSDWSGIMTAVGLNATAIQTSFVMTNAAIDDDTFEVFVDADGNLAEPSDEKADDVKVERGEVDGWTYDPVTPAVVFHGTAVPPRGATIFADYVIDPAGPQSP